MWWKNFNGILNELQKQLYLVLREFYKKRNDNGLEYGFYVGYYSKLESIILIAQEFYSCISSCAWI